MWRTLSASRRALGPGSRRSSNQQQAAASTLPTSPGRFAPAPCIRAAWAMRQSSCPSTGRQTGRGALQLDRPSPSSYTVTSDHSRSATATYPNRLTASFSRRARVQKYAQFGTGRPLSSRAPKHCCRIADDQVPVTGHNRRHPFATSSGALARWFGVGDECPLQSKRDDRAKTIPRPSSGFSPWVFGLGSGQLHSRTHFENSLEPLSPKIE